jgi:hypothetical protein
MESLDIPGNDRGTADLGLDEVADHVREAVRATVSPAAEHLVPLGGSIVGKMHAVVDELGKEDALQERLLDGFDRAIHDQPSAVSAGVDLAAIKAVEPDFDASGFRTLARETFIKVREARGRQRGQAGEGLLSESMERELNDVIAGDVAAHRHRILALLEVIDATIVAAAFEAGRERLGVRFVFSAEEIERDGATEAVISDDHGVHRWAELWQFERDPSLDQTATDQQHILSFGADRWLFAHRGWVVTTITRLQDAVRQPSEA